MTDPIKLAASQVNVPKPTKTPLQRLVAVIWAILMLFSIAVGLGAAAGGVVIGYQTVVKWNQ